MTSKPKPASLRNLTTLMMTPPVIDKARIAREPGLYVVRVFGCDGRVKTHGPDVLVDALGVLRERLNLHIVELHRLSVEVFGEESTQ